MYFGLGMPRAETSDSRLHGGYMSKKKSVRTRFAIYSVAKSLNLTGLEVVDPDRFELSTYGLRVGPR